MSPICILLQARLPMSIIAVSAAAGVNHTTDAKHPHRPSNATSHAGRHVGVPISFVAFDAVVASLCVVMGALIAWLACFMYRRRMPAENDEYHKCGATWSFAEVDEATDGFGEGRLLGRGSRGSVYRAIFPDGQVLAAKRIDPPHGLRSAGSDHALDFAAEVKDLARARHPNVVRVLGHCEAPAERILMMEFMSRRTLQYHLHEGGVLFDWSHRVRIAVQAAQGIEYLHEGTEPPIVHGDVKPSNVLLDSTWSARVADFGLAFLAPPNQVFGTVGYIDPDCRTRLDLCKATDVYAFGVVLLEILSGRPCFANDSRGAPVNSSSDSNYIVDWAVPLIASSRAHEVFDGRLRVPENPQPLVRMAGLAAACVRKARKNRPTILEVVAVLKYIEEGIMTASYVPSQEARRVPLSKNLPV